MGCATCNGRGLMACNSCGGGGTAVPITAKLISRRYGAALTLWLHNALCTMSACSPAARHHYLVRMLQHCKALWFWVRHVKPTCVYMFNQHCHGTAGTRQICQSTLGNDVAQQSLGADYCGSHQWHLQQTREHRTNSGAQDKLGMRTILACRCRRSHKTRCIAMYVMCIIATDEHSHQLM